MHATKACELTRWRESYYFDTLAAAYAEVGDYAKAVEWQSKAVTDAEFKKRVGEEEFSRAKERLELFNAGKPWREPSISQASNGIVSNPSKTHGVPLSKQFIWILIAAGAFVFAFVIIACIRFQIRAARKA